MDVPANVLPNLVCSQCNELLSILPIYSYENGDLICGRCPLILDNKPRRNVAYEIVAEALKYPCIYESSGCIEILSPANLKTHETCCDYRQWKCPHSSCKWKGLITDLKEHHTQSHLCISTSKSYNVFMEDRDWDENFFQKISNNLFLIELKKRDFQLLVDVYLLYENKKYKNYNFNMNLQNDDEIVVIKTPEDSANQYKLNIRKTDDCMFEFTITNLNDLMNNLKVGNEYILKRVECPECKEYMSAPIYQCFIGHVICNKCKARYAICPQCGERVLDTRNLILEDIAENIYYPCKNEGCDHICTYQKIHTHNNVCNYSPYKCPLCRFQSDYSKFVEHLKTKHPAKVFLGELILPKVFFGELTHPICGLVDCRHLHCDIIVKNNSVILVAHYLLYDILYITILRIGPRNIANNFSFEVTVEGSENEYLEFKTRCLNWNAPNRQNFELPLPWLIPFSARSNTWSYKIRIIEQFY